MDGASPGSRRTTLRADVVVAGGGPAGAAAAALLASRGHDVLLFEKERFPRWHIGESIPPVTRNLLDAAGVLDDVEDARFVRMDGTLNLWGSGTFERTLFTVDGRPAQGWQVERGRFDAILLGRARKAGARVHEGARVVDVALPPDGPASGLVRSEQGEIAFEARWFADATGTPGLLARRLGLRRPDPLQRNVAVACYFEGAAPPPAGDPADTYIEAFPDGWIWSLPLANGTRNITVMAGREAAAAIGAKGLRAFFADHLARAPHAAAMAAGARVVFGPRAFDTTWSRAASRAGPGFVLLGDAGAFVDVLTSRGVHRALASALNAALVVGQALRRPTDSALAVEYFDAEERISYEESVRPMREAYALVAGRLRTPFWTARAVPAGPEPPIPPPDAGERERRREELRSAGRSGQVGGIRFRVRAEAVAEDRPVVSLGRIARECVVTTPGNPRGFRHDPRVDLRRLLPLLDGSREVRAVASAYLGRETPAANQEDQRPLMETLTRLYEDGVIAIA